MLKNSFLSVLLSIVYIQEVKNDHCWSSQSPFCYNSIINKKLTHVYSNHNNDNSSKKKFFMQKLSSWLWMILSHDLLSKQKCSKYCEVKWIYLSHPTTKSQMLFQRIVTWFTVIFSWQNFSITIIMTYQWLFNFFSKDFKQICLFTSFQQWFSMIFKVIFIVWCFQWERMTRLDFL